MSPIADSRWRVLPIGRAATLRRAAHEAVLSALLGMVALFAVALITGMLVEEVFAETTVGTSLDLVTRASLVGDLVLGVLGLLTLGLLGALHGPLMARALAAARHQGAPATSVPAPVQWAAARDSSETAYRYIAIGMLALLGLFFVIVILATFSSGVDPVGLAILAGGALLLALIWGGIPLTAALDRRRSRDFEELTQLWTQPHRIIAAGRAMTEQDILEARRAAGAEGDSPARAPLPGSGVRVLSRALLSGVALASMAWVTLFELVVAVAYPEATRHASRQLGDRADLGAEGERLVDMLALGMGVAGAVALLAVAGGVVCAIILRRIEHRVLHRALGDPEAGPPPYALLSQAMAPTSLPILRVLFGLCGAGAVLGIALWFVDAVAESPDWDFYAAAGPELRVAGALGPWIVLAAFVVMALGIVVSSMLDARDQRLRDELVQHWPVRPAEEEADEDTEDGAGTSGD